MTTNSSFKIKNILFLLKRIFIINKNLIFGSLLAYTGVMLIILILALTKNYYNIDLKESLLMAGKVICFWGIVYFTGKLISEIHKPSKAFFYLTIPASAFEKFFSLWLTSSIIFTFVIITLNYLFFIIGTSLKHFAYDPIIFSVLKVYFIEILYYIFFQTIFFVGALYFKKNQLLKTILILVIIFLIPIIITPFLVAELGRLDDPSVFFIVFPGIPRWRLYDIMVFYVTPLLLLISSFYRLKEKEI